MPGGYVKRCGDGLSEQDFCDVARRGAGVDDLLRQVAGKISVNARQVVGDRFPKTQMRRREGR